MKTITQYAKTIRTAQLANKLTEAFEVCQEFVSKYGFEALSELHAEMDKYEAALKVEVTKLSGQKVWIDSDMAYTLNIDVPSSARGSTSLGGKWFPRTVTEMHKHEDYGYQMGYIKLAGKKLLVTLSGGNEWEIY